MGDPVSSLRDYQAKAIDRARQCYAAGARSVLLVSPTGSGKTVILAAIAKGVVDNGGSVTVLVHRRELVDQTVRKLMAVGARANVVTVQSARVPRCSFLIIDEAHHIAADAWSAVALSAGAPRTLGVTATPERGDGRGLSGMFERLVVVAQPSELIA